MRIYFDEDQVECAVCGKLFDRDDLTKNNLGYLVCDHCSYEDQQEIRNEKSHPDSMISINDRLPY